MGNHYHLQLESREANLSKALHWLNVSYSVRFNRKYSRVGPLFQGRFKAILHEPTEALKINRYILESGTDCRPGRTRDSRGRGFKWRAPTLSAGRRPFKPQTPLAPKDVHGFEVNLA